MAFDKNGNMYIADPSNQRIRKINAINGIISTIAGNGIPGFSGDGDSATAASLHFPWGIALDPAGNLYIADSYNNRIRKVDATTQIITTIAGNGNQGYGGDGGDALSANLFWPQGIVLDPSGNVYFSDTQNNHIRKITLTTGVISTIAGNGHRSYSGDNGPATSVALFYPWGITFDNTGNLFIADEGNNCVRKITSEDGLITTIAGNEISHFSGDGGLARAASLSSPSNVCFDSYGNLYIADEGNNRIRKVDNIGIISTIAGTGINNYTEDGQSAIHATLSGNSGMSSDQYGNLYMAAFGDCRIREILINSNTLYLNLQASVYPNPSEGEVTILTNCNSQISVQIFDMQGRLVINDNYTVALRCF